MRGRQEIRLDSRQVGLLVAGGVLMVLVAFALGVLAGRLYFQEGVQQASVSPPPSPPQAAPTHVGVGPGLLPPLPTEPVAGQEASPEAGKGSSPSGPARPADGGDPKAKEAKPAPEEFTFYQTLTGKEKAPHVALQPKETPKESKAAKGAKGAKKNEEGKRARDQEIKKRTATSEQQQAIKEPAGKRFAVQVGAFKERRDAEQLLLSLKDKGYSARLDVAELPGKGTWFRVRVGKFANRAEAEQLVTKLQDQEKRPAIVVTE